MDRPNQSVDHETIARWLSAQHDGELEPQRARQLPERLEPEGAAFVGFLARLDADLAALPALEPSADFAQRVSQALPARAPQRVWQLRPTTLLAAAAALLCGTLMGLGTSSSSLSTANLASPTGSTLAAARDAAYDSTSWADERSAQ